MFEQVETTLLPLVNDLNNYLSSYILVFLLIGVGLFYSIRTRFVQVRCFGEGMKKVFGSLSLRGLHRHGAQQAAQGGRDTHPCYRLLCGGPYDNSLKIRLCGPHQRDGRSL